MTSMISLQVDNYIFIYLCTLKQKYQNTVRNALFTIFPVLSALRSTGFLPGKLDFAIRAAYFMSNSLVTEMLPVLQDRRHVKELSWQRVQPDSQV